MKILYKTLAVLLFCYMRSSAQPLPKDLLINEILFNPIKDGYDYIECYNRSNRVIRLNELTIANRNSTGDISSVKILTRDSLTIEPGQYLLITANKKWLRNHYNVPQGAVICEPASMPSFPDEQGSVVLARKTDSTIIDEVSYSHKWHFQLLNEPTGVALERISVEGPSEDENNWTSASSASGYGTPGAFNSQTKIVDEHPGGISVLPAVVSPDNDGRDDFALITIGYDSQGKIANAIIFDAFGRRIRYLLKNEVLGNYNRFVWDGFDDASRLAPPGIYILLTRIFDVNGYSKKFKNCIVVR